MICAGIDAGSRAIKIVLVEADGLEVVAAGVLDQGVRQDVLANELFEQLMADKGIKRSDVGRIVGTGYGRDIVSIADTTVTEITCHAVGVHHVSPEASTIIDIGGQDSKLIRLNADGGVRDFAMNDRCAAGTGRFLEMVASRLGVEIESLGELARKSHKPATISSMCVVFAETEIIGLLASGARREDIVAGVQASIASRIAAMAGRRIELPIVFTGGGAMVPGMTVALSTALGQPISSPPCPQLTGALGAAILAARQLRNALAMPGGRSHAGIAYLHPIGITREIPSVDTHSKAASEMSVSCSTYMRSLKKEFGVCERDSYPMPEKSENQECVDDSMASNECVGQDRQSQRMLEVGSAR